MATEHPELPPPLEGVRVLDLTRLLPGPLCTLHLADMGADVIKIEDPEHGDYARDLRGDGRGAGSLFLALNRNKRGLRLNLKAPQGPSVLHQLARSADVVVEGFRPGVVDRLGVGYESLRADNPAIVYCAITGYGQTGPYRDRAGHDINYCGYAGVLDQIGSAGGPPVIPNFQIGDIVGGALSAAMGILAALVASKSRGLGRYVDVSMTDCLLANAVIPLATLGDTGKSPMRGEDLLSGGVPCYSVYPTRDGRYMAVGALEPKFWHRLCDALERPDLRSGQLETGVRGDVVRRALADIFQTRDRDEWTADLTPLDCCVTPVLSVLESLGNEQITQRGMVDRRADAGVDIGGPIRFGNTACSPNTPAPARGQDTDTILLEAGFEPAEVRRLREDGVV